MRMPRVLSLLTVAMVMCIAPGGCATKAEKRAEELADLRELNERLSEKALQRENERKEHFIAAVPAWAMTTRAPDAQGVYGAGSGESEVLATAVRKARLQAEFELAKQMGQEISGSERNFEEDRGEGRPITRYTQLIDKLVAEIPVVGAETLEQEVMPIQGKYHAFVLMKLPYEAFNKALQQRQAASTDRTIKEAFGELERRLDKRREAHLKTGGEGGMNSTDADGATAGVVEVENGLITRETAGRTSGGGAGSSASGR